MLKVGIIVASIRIGQNGHIIGNWVNAYVQDNKDLEVGYELVSMADYDLPYLITTPALASGASVDAWKAKMASFDAFIYIVPEFNKSIHGAFKNALDHLQVEVDGKAVAYVGYGLLDGIEAVKALRIINQQQKMVCIQEQVNINVTQQIDDNQNLTLTIEQEASLKLLLHELITAINA